LSPRRNARRGEELVHQLADRVARLPVEQRQRGQLRGLDRLLAGQRVARRDDQQQVVPPGAAALEGRLVGDDLDEADVQVAVHHPVLDQLGVAHRNPRHHPRVAPLEAFDQPGQPVGPPMVVLTPSWSTPDSSSVSSETRSSISSDSPRMRSA
jgi:hypothetical protein